MIRINFFALLLLLVKGLQAQTVSISDPDFLAHLKSAYPSAINSNDELIIAQAATFSGSFNCSNKNIHSLEGLQYFTNVTRVDASDNFLTSCEQVSGLSLITKLNVSNNQITSLPMLNSLSNMSILIVSKNELTQLPDLSANVKLKEIIAFTNKLSTLPSFAGLNELEKVDLGNNLLTQTPDFSSNLRMKFLSIDRNFLTSIPDLSSLDSLTEVQFHQNYFTFSDLVPISSYPDFSSNFTISPQRKISHSDLQLISTDTLYLVSGKDQNISGMSYAWYFQNAPLATADNDSAIIYPAQKKYEGYYYGVLTCTAIPGLQIYTDSFYVSITNCPGNNDFTFEYGTINCLKSGSLKISLPSMPVQSYLFELEPTSKGMRQTSSTGVFEHLIQPVYHLKVYSGNNCVLQYPELIHIPFEDCKETFITPDGDGDKDVFYFDQKGTVIIYDKDGAKISSLALPAEWDGTTDKGKKVAQGYYVCDVNNGEEVVRITVIY